MDEREFEVRSERYADAAVPLRPTGTALIGDEAAAEGRAFLIREYGSEEVLEQEIRRGRPAVGSSRKGDAPVVRGRLPERDFEAFKLLERLSGKKQSELVREAVHNLLVQNKLVS